MARHAKPDKYAKTLAIKMSEAEHMAIKTLASRQKKTIKALLLEVLEKSFPDWRQS